MGKKFEAIRKGGRLIIRWAQHVRSANSYWNRVTLYPALLILLMGFHLVVNYLWLRKDTAPPTWDPADYLYKSELLYRSLKEGGIPLFMKNFIYEGYRTLSLFLTIPFYFLFGESEMSAMMVEFLSMGVLCLSLYGIGKILKDERAGLLAAYISTTMPLVFGLSRMFFPEFPLIAVVALNVYLLLKSDYFKKTKYNIYLGLAMGLGMLIKITFPLFIIGPFLLILFKRTAEEIRLHRQALSANGQSSSMVFQGPDGEILFWKEVPRAEKSPRFVQDVGIVILLTLVLSSIWYFPNATYAVWIFLWGGYGHLTEVHGFDQHVFSPHTILGYQHLVIYRGLSSFYFTLFTLALLYYLFLKKLLRRNLTLSRTPFVPVILLWFLIPLLAFTFATNKDLRFFAPSLPAFGILLSLLLVSVFQKDLYPVYGVALGIPLFLFYSLSFLPSEMFNNKIYYVLLGTRYVAMGRGYYNLPPIQEDWKTEQILHTLQAYSNHSNSDGQPPQIAIISNQKYFNRDLFKYLAYHQQQDNPAQAMKFRYCDHYSMTFSLEECLRIVNMADYVLFKTGDQGPAYSVPYNSTIIKMLEEHKLPFREVSCDITLPDQSKVRLFKKVVEHPAEANNHDISKQETYAFTSLL